MKTILMLILFAVVNFAYADNSKSSCVEHVKLQKPIIFYNVAIDHSYFDLDNMLLEAGYIHPCYSYKVDHEANNMIFMIEDKSKVANLDCFLRLTQATQYLKLQHKTPNLPYKELNEFLNISDCSSLATTDDFLNQRFEYYYSLHLLLFKK